MHADIDIYIIKTKTVISNMSFSDKFNIFCHCYLIFNSDIFKFVNKRYIFNDELIK